MDKPVRVQLSRKKGWRMPENTVSVARPGRNGNPFRIGWYATEIAVPRAYVGGFPCGYPYSTSRDPLAGMTLIADATDAVRRFADYKRLWGLTRDERALAGSNLACWCALDQPCHADVLLELANA